MKHFITSTSTELDRAEYLSFLESKETYIKQIYASAMHVYVRVQEIRLEMLGYSWGPVSNLTAPCQKTYEIIKECWEELRYDKDSVTVNYLTGGQMTFPATWLSDSDFEDQIRKLCIKEQQREVLRKLEK